MTATIENLKDKNGNTIYPVTKTNAVLDNNNIDVGTLISNEATARQNADANLQNNKVDLNGYGWLPDMDTVVTANKVFWTNQSTLNIPNNDSAVWGTVVYNYGGYIDSASEWFSQLYFPNDQDYFYKRERVNGAWKAWRKISEKPTQVLGADGTVSSFNTTVENTTDTWFPVLKDNVFQHRTLENMMASTQAANAEIARNHRETWDTGRNDNTQGNNSGWYQFLKITKTHDWSDQSYIISLQSFRWGDGAVGIFNIKVRWGNTDTAEGCNIRWLSRYNIEQNAIIGVQEGNSIRFYVYCNGSDYQKYCFKIISAYGDLNYGTRSSDTLAYPTAKYTSRDAPNNYLTSQAFTGVNLDVGYGYFDIPMSNCILRVQYGQENPNDNSKCISYPQPFDSVLYAMTTGSGDVDYQTRRITITALTTTYMELNKVSSNDQYMRWIVFGIKNY